MLNMTAIPIFCKLARIRKAILRVDARVTAISRSNNKATFQRLLTLAQLEELTELVAERAEGCAMEFDFLKYQLIFKSFDLPARKSCRLKILFSAAGLPTSIIFLRSKSRARFHLHYLSA